MQIDPKYSFWFGVFTSILLGLATGAVNLPSSIPHDIATQITGWCAFFGWINSVILTALNGYSSSKSGPLTAIPAPAPTTIAKVLIVAFALSFLLAGAPANAQTKLTGNIAKDFNLPKPSGPSSDAETSTDKAMGSFGQEVRKITKQLVDKAIVDVQAALDDATKHNDAISIPCWQANLDLLKGLPSQWENPPQDIGIALGIQIQRDLLNSITGTDAKSLKVACAALWGDQLKIVANVGALLGVRIATGGLL